MNRLIELRHTPLDPLEVEGAVAHLGAGAVVNFIGRVRDHNDGKPVAMLEYEAYPAMAEREMAAIVSEIEGRLPGTRLAVVHRVGTLEVGAAAVIVAASAPHRSEAFEACRRLIDAIKARVPIWKREHGPDGPYWVGWEDARCSGQEHRPMPHGGTSEQHRHEHRHDRSQDDSHSQDGGHLHGVRHVHDSDRVQGNDGEDHTELKGLRFDCITVSDTRSIETDRSGALAQRLLTDRGAIVTRHLVRDDAAEIAALVQQCCRERPAAILLNGGTGIGPRDVTHEALRPLFDRILDGFGETFRRLSVEAVGARGLLSRAIAGTMGGVLVFAVPGSPRAVELACKTLVVPLVPHALTMLEGQGH